MIYLPKFGSYLWFGFDCLFFFETNKTKRTNTETSQQPTKTRPFFEAMKPLLLKQMDEKKWFIKLVEIGKMTICLVHQFLFPWQFLGVMEMGNQPRDEAAERFGLIIREAWWLRGLSE